ncbi:MAG: hypothetical protein QM774_00210 [Gordonia sp. (in: high G+C Gram-positive bacteria)]|uniref:hypothetical protein n=1 Tax=Gordonia sp. (in: high G+C Gram-positive bacteria) TaxID=84139 RepID=UPI0039E2ED52
MSRPIYGYEEESDANRAGIISALSAKLVEHGFSLRIGEEMHPAPVSAETALKWGFPEMKRILIDLLTLHEILLGNKYDLLTEGGTTDPDGQPVPRFGRLGPGVELRNGTFHWKRLTGD